MALLIGIAALHGLLFLVSIPGILRSGASREQIRLQLAFSLLVPFAGPLITNAVHRSDRQLPPGSERPMGSSIDESAHTGVGYDRPEHHD